jgi:hypothetical protein
MIFFGYQDIEKANNSISYILVELCNRSKVLSDIRCFRSETVEIVQKDRYCNSGLTQNEHRS